MSGGARGTRPCVDAPDRRPVTCRTPKCSRARRASREDRVRSIHLDEHRERAHRDPADAILDQDLRESPLVLAGELGHAVRCDGSHQYVVVQGDLAKLAGGQYPSRREALPPGASRGTASGAPATRSSSGSSAPSDGRASARDSRRRRRKPSCVVASKRSARVRPARPTLGRGRWPSVPRPPRRGRAKALDAYGLRVSSACAPRARARTRARRASVRRPVASRSERLDRSGR